MLSISPRAMVLALSSWPEAEALALMAGAAAFVSKGDPPPPVESATDPRRPPENRTVCRPPGGAYEWPLPTHRDRKSRRLTPVCGA